MTMLMTGEVQASQDLPYEGYILNVDYTQSPGCLPVIDDVRINGSEHSAMDVIDKGILDYLSRMLYLDAENLREAEQLDFRYGQREGWDD